MSVNYIESVLIYTSYNASFESMELLYFTKTLKYYKVDFSFDKVDLGKMREEENVPWPLRKHLHDSITVPTQYILNTYVRRKNTSYSSSVIKDPLGIVSFNYQNF
jgi:hypothetical protein